MHIGRGYFVPPGFTSGELTTSVASSVGDLDLAGHVLIVLLRGCRPPSGCDQVAEHLVHRHAGDGEAEREHVLISQPGLGIQILDIRWCVERSVELHLNLAGVVLAVAPEALVMGRDEMRANAPGLRTREPMTWR